MCDRISARSQWMKPGYGSVYTDNQRRRLSLPEVGQADIPACDWILNVHEILLANDLPGFVSS